jgi:hypothetical protein
LNPALQERGERGDEVRSVPSDPSEITAGTTRALAAQLAPMLGWEKSVEVVASAVRRLGLKDGELGPEDRQAILEDLALESGLVGVTARYALSRSSSSRSEMQAVAMPPSSQRPAQPSVPPDSSASALLAGTMGVHEVIGQLAPLMGGDKAELAVHGCLKRLGLPRERLDREQAARLWDELCRQEGHTGITARFVRPRVMAKLGT